MRIEVKQEHIDKGVQTKCKRCPVALALRDATGRGWYVNYDWADTAAGNLVRVYLPWEATRAIEDFDDGRGMTPFSFEVEIPENLPCSQP